MAPKTVPNRALATVTPFKNAERANRWVRVSVVPEITTVSKPNTNPPSAATIALLIKVPFSFMRSPDVEIEDLNDNPILFAMLQLRRYSRAELRRHGWRPR